ncbi:MAG TPA: sugar phosphate isomerase/epimerase family protein [Fimbriimonadaceae bacterium]|nr:sugar phosphate isomerase/epimerase family protein [Fimbriimonadaceae bacterium]
MPPDKKRTITGFGDEISPDLDVQLAVLRKLDIEALDLRSAYGKNVLQLSDGEVDRVGESVKARGLRVQAIGSPVNKVKFSDRARADELRRLERAAEIANRLGVARIRIFSPETDPAGGSSAWPEVREWMAEQVSLAESKGVLLIHENDARYFGAFPANAMMLFDALGGPHFKAAFDFGNSVLIGYRTMRDWFPWILPHLDTLHIKDAVEADGRFVFAGEGDGEMVECFRFLFSEGWDGPLTLEPHAAHAGPQGGFSGEEAFSMAAAALRKVLAQASA